MHWKGRHMFGGGPSGIVQMMGGGMTPYPTHTMPDGSVMRGATHGGYQGGGITGPAAPAEPSIEQRVARIASQQGIDIPTARGRLLQKTATDQGLQLPPEAIQQFSVGLISLQDALAQGTPARQAGSMGAMAMQQPNAQVQMQAGGMVGTELFEEGDSDINNALNTMASVSNPEVPDMPASNGMALPGGDMGDGDMMMDQGLEEMEVLELKAKYQEVALATVEAANKAIQEGAPPEQLKEPVKERLLAIDEQYRQKTGTNDTILTPEFMTKLQGLTDVIPAMQMGGLKGYEPGGVVTDDNVISNYKGSTGKIKYTPEEIAEKTGLSLEKAKEFSDIIYSDYRPDQLGGSKKAAKNFLYENQPRSARKTVELSIWSAESLVDVIGRGKKPVTPTVDKSDPFFKQNPDGTFTKTSAGGTDVVKKDVVKKDVVKKDVVDKDDVDKDSYEKILEQIKALSTVSSDSSELQKKKQELARQAKFFGGKTKQSGLSGLFDVMGQADEAEVAAISNMPNQLSANETALERMRMDIEAQRNIPAKMTENERDLANGSKIYAQGLFDRLLQKEGDIGSVVEDFIENGVPIPEVIGVAQGSYKEGEKIITFPSFYQTAKAGNPQLTYEQIVAAWQKALSENSK